MISWITKSYFLESFSFVSPIVKSPLIEIEILKLNCDFIFFGSNDLSCNHAAQTDDVFIIWLCNNPCLLFGNVSNNIVLAILYADGILIYSFTVNKKNRG